MEPIKKNLLNYNFREFSAESTIIVLGDIMLDQYYYGDVQRISPEAPVPIVKVSKSHHTLGGAGNVANNLSLLGCKVFLAGITGHDANRDLLCRMMEQRNIDFSGIVVRETPTITKTRVIGGHQQMVRLDFEETSYLNQEEFNNVVDWFIRIVNTESPGAVVISDYGKGVCTEEFCKEIISICKARGLPVLIDPKGPNWNKYDGATFVTPNIKELSEVSLTSITNKDEEIEIYGKKVCDKFNIENLLITRSEMGMTLLSKYGVSHIPTRAQEVFDVSGAGDTVIATLAAFISRGFDKEDSVKLSNLAAGVVVGKLGTYPISTKELWDAISSIDEKNIGSTRKIMTQEQLKGIVSELKNQGRKIVFTNGCFDIPHIGHIAYLESAKSLGNYLIVGLNSDSSVKRLKGEKRPINSEMDRARLLAAMEFIDCIVIFDEDTPIKLIQNIEPDVLVKGGDYQIADVVGREYAGVTAIIPFIEGYSTTGIIKKVASEYSREHGVV